ncbi:Hypothetical predicted protein [Paramuricea clavata]|uniref:Uncharacterized protein n=1 Tax=Paramuricea clavata TaxID=317549 RepID=A0A7D9I1G7_PARCT|nr:Hypothetical predicted protein [Paramuricea clavata]
MSETWLNSTVTNGEFANDDYKIYRLDKLHKKGGGVCAFVKKALKVTILNELTYTAESNFQQLWIKLQNKKRKTIIICVTYRPQDCPLNCIQDDFRQNYVRALSMNKPIFILGDLNCNLLKDCPEKRAITELCNDLNLKQIIKEPTRIRDTSQSLIDVILVSTEAVVLESGVLDSAISDHFPTYVSAKLNVPKTTYITVRSYKNYDPTAFSSDLATKSDRLLSIFTETDVTTKTEVLKDVLQSTLDLHAPIKTIRSRSRANTFVTRDTKELMKSRDKLHQRLLKTRCKRDWEMYAGSRNKVKVMLKEAAINHLSDEVKVRKNNPGSLWKIINKTIPVKEKEKHIYTKDLKSIVEDFNNYFTSVGKITAATALDLANKNNIALSDPMLNSEIYPTNQQFKFKPVTCSVIRRIIMAMPRNKSPGPDKISIGVIKDCLAVIPGPLTNLINSSLALAGKVSSDLDSYVDDSKLHLAFLVEDIQQTIAKLENDLYKTAKWCLEHQLLINPDKTKFLLVGTRSMLQNLPTQIKLNFLGKTLKPVSVVKDLGMHLDLHHSYDDHISKPSLTCINKSCQISRVKESIDKKTLILLIEALVINKLLYSYSVWANTSSKNLKKWQTVQNFACRIITS